MGDVNDYRFCGAELKEASATSLLGQRKMLIMGKADTVSAATGSSKRPCETRIYAPQPCRRGDRARQLFLPFFQQFAEKPPKLSSPMAGVR
jgi:hypothetical protein